MFVVANFFLKKRTVSIVASSEKGNCLSSPVLKKGIFFHREFWKRELSVVVSSEKGIVCVLVSYEKGNRVSLSVLKKGIISIVVNFEKGNCLCGHQFWKKKLFVVASFVKGNYLSLPILKKGIVHRPQFWKRKSSVSSVLKREFHVVTSSKEWSSLSSLVVKQGIVYVIVSSERGNCLSSSPVLKNKIVFRCQF